MLPEQGFLVKHLRTPHLYQEEKALELAGVSPNVCAQELIP